MYNKIYMGSLGCTGTLSVAQADILNGVPELKACVITSSYGGTQP